MSNRAFPPPLGGPDNPNLIGTERSAAERLFLTGSHCLDSPPLVSSGTLAGTPQSPAFAAGLSSPHCARYLSASHLKAGGSSEARPRVPRPGASPGPTETASFSGRVRVWLGPRSEPTRTPPTAGLLGVSLSGCCREVPVPVTVRPGPCDGDAHRGARSLSAQAVPHPQGGERPTQKGVRG